MERAVSLYHTFPGTPLVMTGGIVTPGASDACAMREYLLEKKIPPDLIYLEESALDTIGNAVFTKKEVVIPQQWNTLAIVTHESHMKRVQEIFSFVYGDNYQLSYEAVSHIISPTVKELEEEQRSLLLFRDRFKGVMAGDHPAMLERLLDGTHPAYEPKKLR